jgi:hypothetical protein
MGQEYFIFNREWAGDVGRVALPFPLSTYVIIQMKRHCNAGECGGYEIIMLI